MHKSTIELGGLPGHFFSQRVFHPEPVQSVMEKPRLHLFTYQHEIAPTERKPVSSIVDSGCWMKGRTDMGIKAKKLCGICLIFLLSGASLAAPSDDFQLLEAVKKRSQKAVLSLLQSNVNVNAAQPDGATALMWAVHLDDLDTAELLIRAGADVNAANEYGATALWLACTNGNFEEVKMLIGAGANPNPALRSGETALMACAGRGMVDAIKLLLARGADVNAKEIQGRQTALMWAIAEKHPDVVRELIENGADASARTRDGFTPVLFAAYQGAPDSARMLLESGANVNETTLEGMSVLAVATARRHETLALYLLEKGADPNVADRDGYTALHNAAAENMLGTVKALLASGANPNAQLIKNPVRGDSHIIHVGATPFFLAASAHHIAVMHVLAANGADPRLATTGTVFLSSSNGRRLRMVAETTPLMVAAGAGRYRNNYPPFTEEEENRALEAVSLALELGADVNAANAYGQTALHATAYLGAEKIVQFLMEQGARLNVMDKFGQTPLSITERVHTVGLGDDFDMQPRIVYKNTTSLLLKLGATPLAASGVEIVQGLE
jgi:ankyrin repeat protein